MRGAAAPKLPQAARGNVLPAVGVPVRVVQVQVLALLALCHVTCGSCEASLLATSPLCPSPDLLLPQGCPGGPASPWPHLTWVWGALWGSPKAESLGALVQEKAGVEGVKPGPEQC